MAESIIQGVPIQGLIDLTDLGVFSDVQLELYSPSNNKTVAIAKYLQPAEGQYSVTKTGNVYSFEFPSELTELLLGNYGIELTYFDSDGEVIDKCQATGLTIISEAK